ncbi:MAG: MBL fold metallo-hydrolase [Candidatus Bathyarchaeota archaeon]|nr:MBL fold metallo-hydrolase [Candidatus Bathyarchaeota archaeon]
MVKNVRLTCIVENLTGIPYIEFLGKHGFSLFLEIEREHDKLSLLMDTGPSPDVFSHNLNILKLEMGKVEAIVLSHGHYDHTGGLVEALKRIGKKDIPVIAHPEAFNLKFAYRLRYVGIPFKPIEVEEAGGRLILVKNPLWITDDVVVTGEIERITGFEDVKGFWTIKDGVVKEDAIPDDQALILKLNNKGLLIISGCAHAGIVNTVKYAQKITRVSRIYGVVGGFHLEGASKERLEQTLNEFKGFNPEVIAPCHCTGFEATKLFAEVFEKKLILLKSGLSTTFQ